MKLGLVLLGLLIAAPAWAQTGALSDCSQTVGASSTAVAFPGSGKTGPAAPSTYIELCNAHATNTLGINATGGTASIGSQGTLTLQPGGCTWWNQAVIPLSISIIGSGAGTTTACWYK